MQRWFAFALLLLAPCVAWAHIGSPNVIYEGLAGPYALRVIIRPPGVVPGLADISVRVLQGRVDRITVLPVRYDTGSKGSPTPDLASPVKGESDLYSAQLWLMTSGAHSIFVNVEGPAGAGTTVIPINSVATTRLQMPWWFGGGLLAFAIFLVLALVSIVGAAVRDGVLPPGQTAARSWRTRLGMGLAAVLLILLLFGGRKWWDSVDSDYRNNRLYKPEPIAASVRLEHGKQVLALERLDNRRGRPRLIPDHGKLMHAFLVRKSDQNAFAHLHPIHAKQHTYESVLPDLPTGTYRVYADVTHESGFTQTLTTELLLTNSIKATELSDPDDAWIVSNGSSSQSDQTTFALPDGLSLKWDVADPLTANSETSLRFRVLETSGALAVLEPYLGMRGHAVIEEKEGRVFTHIHPFGNISIASQQRFVERERTRGAKPNLEVVCGLPDKGDAIVFPYEFPRAGQYRIWVQVKTHGKVMTAFFDAHVIDKPT